MYLDYTRIEFYLIKKKLKKKEKKRKKIRSSLSPHNMNIYEILSMKLFPIILGYPQRIPSYNNLMCVGREIALGLADTQRCLDTFICPKREAKKSFFIVMKSYEDQQQKLP